MPNTALPGGAAVDPELKAYLDAMRAETRNALEAMDQRTDQRFAEAQKAMDTRLAETKHTLEAKIEEARRQAGADREAIIAEIRALPEGFSTFQRAEADRLDAAREQAMLNRHILPLEASAADHEKRIKTMEKKAR